MESVQSHLSSWLTNTLSSNTSNHFTWINQTWLEPFPDLSNKPLKTFTGQSFFADNVFSTEHLAQVSLHQDSGILICIIEKMAVT